MNYAAIIKAEEGYRAVLAREDGTPSFVPVQAWGVVANIEDSEYETRRCVVPNAWMPLDELQECLSSKHNFVMLLLPNEEENAIGRTNDIRNRCIAKAKALRENRV